MSIWNNRIPPHDLDPEPYEHDENCSCEDCGEPSALDKHYLSQRPTCEEGLCMEPSVAIIYEELSHGAQWPKAVCAKHK
jgi:hypothetical protein